MGFVVKKALRENIFAKIALMSPSGGGKTYSSLKIATGMANEIEKTTGSRPKIIVGSTEQKRGYYYANEFDYDIVDIEAPHNPEKYVEFIDFAIKEGYGIVIIDSSSHEWEGKGGCLELQQAAGGTYQSWGKVTPRHNKFIEAIADSPVHIIATMRGKDQYEVEKDDKGKVAVKKLGVGAKQRDGFEYEFTCTFLLDQKTHMAEAQKDNTHIFENEVSFLLNESYGEKIIQWANSGAGYTPPLRKTMSEKAVGLSEEDTLESVKKDILALASELVKKDKDSTMSVIKEYVASGNPNAINSLEDAKSLLEKLNQM